MSHEKSVLSTVVCAPCSTTREQYSNSTLENVVVQPCPMHTTVPPAAQHNFFIDAQNTTLSIAGWKCPVNYTTIAELLHSLGPVLVHQRRFRLLSTELAVLSILEITKSWQGTYRSNSTSTSIQCLEPVKYPEYNSHQLSVSISYTPASRTSAWCMMRHMIHTLDDNILQTHI